MFGAGQTSAGVRPTFRTSNSTQGKHMCTHQYTRSTLSPVARPRPGTGTQTMSATQLKGGGAAWAKGQADTGSPLRTTVTHPGAVGSSPAAAELASKPNAELSAMQLIPEGRGWQRVYATHCSASSSASRVRVSSCDASDGMQAEAHSVKLGRSLEQSTSQPPPLYTSPAEPASAAHTF